MSSQIITIDDGSTALATVSAPAVAASTSIASQEEELDASKMTDVLDNVDLNAEADLSSSEQRKLKRKQSLESQVTSGCGGGKKKARIVDAFYGTLWPILEQAGWKMVSGPARNCATKILKAMVQCVCVHILFRYIFVFIVLSVVFAG